MNDQGIDPIAGKGTPGPWVCDGEVLYREDVAQVATAIRDASPEGIRFADIWPQIWRKPGEADRRLDRALQLLKKWGLIKQGKYPRWVWRRRPEKGTE